MPIFNTIQKVFDIFSAIKDRIDTVKGFEQRSKRLLTRVEAFTPVVTALKNSLSDYPQLCSGQSAIRGVSLAVHRLEEHLKKIQEFLIKLAGTSLVKQFFKFSEYGDQFTEFTEELRIIHFDLQSAMDTEIFIIVVSQDQREKLAKPLKASSECLEERKIQDEDKEDQQNDEANLMTLLQNMEESM